MKRYQAFRLAYAPPSCWRDGPADESDGGSQEGQEGSYTYIRMELCDGGDLESYMRPEGDSAQQVPMFASGRGIADGVPGEKVLSVEDITTVCFQVR